MYVSLSHTFNSATEGKKKFFLTLQKQTKEVTFEGKINEDKTVKKFLMKQDNAGAWKIDPQTAPVQDWVMALEGDFSNRIEEIAAR